MAKKTTINMMLANEYVSNWGVREALREIIANATDADPDHSISFEDDVITIETATFPSVTETVLMGAGSKSADDDNIGQFGEGLKLAALVLQRGRHQLTIATPDGTTRFALRTAPHLDRKTLHAIIDTTACTDEGCIIQFRAAGIRDLYRSTFLPRAEAKVYGPRPKPENAKGVRIYHRGILVCRLDEYALYDWNLRSVRLNRDRTIPEQWSLQSNVASLLDAAICADPTIADEVLLTPESLEGKCWRTTYGSTECQQIFASAIQNRWGDKACLTSGTSGRDNALAEARGHSVIVLPSDLAEVAQRGGVKRASEVICQSDKLTQIPRAEQRWPDEFAELRKLLDIVGIGATSIFVFEPHVTTMGVFDQNGIWLSEELFQPGKRFERLRVMCHELGHKKGGGDATMVFEHSLDFIAGKLAEKLLDVTS